MRSLSSWSKFGLFKFKEQIFFCRKLSERKEEVAMQQSAAVIFFSFFFSFASAVPFLPPRPSAPEARTTINQKETAATLLGLPPISEKRTTRESWPVLSFFLGGGKMPKKEEVGGGKEKGASFSLQRTLFSFPSFFLSLCSDH